MADLPIYMDNHATTRVDPRVLDAMLPFFSERLATRAAPVTGTVGKHARRSMRRGNRLRRQSARSREKSCSPAARRKATIWRCAAWQSGQNCGVPIPRPTSSASPPSTKPCSIRWSFSAGAVAKSLCCPWSKPAVRRAGLISPQQVADAIRENTVLVSVMLANNEIGAIQPIAEIGAICRQRGILLHCDATQGVGKIHVDVAKLHIDLMSFSAHKIYGPKGIGALYIRRSAPVVKLEPQIFGGGQENGLRSGTANVPGIVGFAKALELCIDELPREQSRLSGMRNRLFDGLNVALADISLNGPALDRPDVRLANNLNLSFKYVDGEALLLDMQARLAVSSGSACTSANPQPSHVLRALGLSDDAVRSSLRFGLGRFNSAADVETAIEIVADSVNRLRKLSSMA